MQISKKLQQQLLKEMIGKFGQNHQEQIEMGIRQVAARWQEADGSDSDFQTFCLENFYADAASRAQLTERFQANLESLYGNLHHIYRDFNWPLHVDEGDMVPIDNQFANFDVFAHVAEDMFKTKLAFVVLLNYPLPPLAEKNEAGRQWSRRQWAEVRLAEQFADRIPGDVKQKRTAAYTAAEEYIYGYNIFMNNVLSENGERLFPENMRLISHWGLRDELKAQYANADGFQRQKLIEKIMFRIILQEIPQIVIGNPEVDWAPESNTVTQKESAAAEDNTAEADARYQVFLEIFKAEQALDPFTVDNPSLIERRFNEDREIAETEVEELLKAVLTAPVLKDIANLLQEKLQRPLAAFDIWYPGFKAGGEYSEDRLNDIVQNRYPNIAALQDKMPDILRNLGFQSEKADYLQAHIQIDAARGAGHAMGAKMRRDRAHLRTRVPAGGMDYKGFNTAMHELGHTVEQVFSMNDVDHYTLEGVPNTAFTEAFAFVFQGRDLDVLGLIGDAADVESTQAIHELWQTLEIAGVSLLDMKIWRWLYANPNAAAAELKSATVSLAIEIWNEFYAPIFGVQDQPLLAIYSHLIFCGMYIPDYAIGQIIAFQIEDYLRERDLAKEMERMCRLGRLTPQVWMQEALGTPISAAPMIQAAEKAIAAVNGSRQPAD